MPGSAVLQLTLLTVAAAFAFVRMRPAILVFSANHAAVVLGLMHIDEGGRPLRYAYNPQFLFETDTVARALEICLVPTILLACAALVPGPTNPPPRRSLPRIPTPLLVIIGGYLLLIAASSRTIFEASYTSVDQGSSGGLTGGIYPLAWAFVLLAMRERIDAGAIRPSRAFAGVVALLVVLDFSKGSTGLAAGVFVAALLLVYVPGMLRDAAATQPRTSADTSAASEPRATPRQTARVLGIAAVIVVALVTLVVLIRGSRAEMSRVGVVDALAAATETLAADDDVVGIESRANGDQGAVHVLMCAALYDGGISREWRSVWGPFEYTFKPSLLMRWLNLTRSPEAAWELMDYFIHLGGINTFGEFYWNGGFLCLFVMSFLLIGALFWLDVASRWSTVALAMSCAVIPNLVQGYGYGFAQIFRGFSNGALFVLPVLAYLRYVEWERSKKKHALSRPVALAPAK
ncbi:MAG: hypothetical protein J0L92_06535 [Deltaproteobacteria bacterium]|nr:hypothetical protein [Deltaproteobacteria bacterium]